MKNILLLFSVLLLAGCSGDDGSFLGSGDDAATTDTGSKRSGRKGREVNVNITVDVDKEGKRTDSPWRQGLGKDKGPAPGGGAAESGKKPGGTAGGSPPSKRRGPAAKAGPVTDILFYLAHKNHGQCWHSLSKSIEANGFFYHLSNLNWQAATAFYSNNPSLYQFRADRYQGGLSAPTSSFWTRTPVFVLYESLALSKKTKASPVESDRILYKTLRTAYVRDVAAEISDHGQPRRIHGPPVFPLGSRPAEDPLFGLTRLLAENPYNFRRPGGLTVVILFEFDKYYYTGSEWKAFLQKHKGVRFVTLSSRAGSGGGNLPFNAQLGLKWFPCGYPDISRHVTDYINAISGVQVTVTK